MLQGIAGGSCVVPFETSIDVGGPPDVVSGGISFTAEDVDESSSNAKHAMTCSHVSGQPGPPQFSFNRELVIAGYAVVAYFRCAMLAEITGLSAFARYASFGETDFAGR